MGATSGALVTYDVVQRVKASSEVRYSCSHGFGFIVKTEHDQLGQFVDVSNAHPPPDHLVGPDPHTCVSAVGETNRARQQIRSS